MKILLKFLIAMLWAILLPAVSFAVPMFTITPSSTSLNVPKNGSGAVSFTVTNSIGTNISANITYTANIAENSPFQSSIASSSSCGSSLMKGQSCQLDINVQAGNQLVSGFLLPRVCYRNNCSSTVVGPGSVLVTVSNVTPTSMATFTTCGATGNNGPSMAQCNAAYANTALAGKVTISGSGIQQWTVPATGTYRIEAFGAQGGIGTSSNSFVGGLGADMRGDFTLTAGQVLDIVVGQMGTTTIANGGGGGGSFVVISTGPTPILVAGGGGGLREEASVNGFNASTGTAGVNGTDSGNGIPGTICAGGTGGGGGSICPDNYGSGGGGYSGNGVDDSPDGTGGRSFLNGAVGGQAGIGACEVAAYGGFGGGGAGNGCEGGGGGGGYSGGGGGFVAGGGGSFNTGANQLNTAGVQSGDGKVTITFLN